MKIFKVLCLNETYKIIAKGWSVGVEGLTFYDDDMNIIAWFTTWDYWIYLGNENETQPS